MKTAMKELQERITALINASKDTGSNRDNPDYRIGLHQALSLIDFEAEKEQITEAYRSGKHDSGIDKCFNSAEYYTQTFKSDE